MPIQKTLANGMNGDISCAVANSAKAHLIKFWPDLMTAFHAKADIKLILVKGSANDPKRTSPNTAE